MDSKNSRLFVVCAMALFLVPMSSAFAQQNAPTQPMDPMPGMQHPAEHEHDMSSMKGVHHHSPVAQYGSGTGWRPASTPEYMWMTTTHDWTFMEDMSCSCSAGCCIP